MFTAIHIADFPVEAIVRAEPELRERAVAVVEGTPPVVHVAAVNERAAQLGVERGMTKWQAEGMVASKAGTLRQRSAELEAAAHAALLDCACGFSPRVEDTALDTVVLDVAGLERIFGPPAKMARDIARRCSEMGLEANIAVAFDPDTAVLAARDFTGVTLIAEGKEAERLGELPVEVLVGGERSVAGGQWSGTGEAGAASVQEILETLERWGVHNLRALAALPPVAVAERLGQEGLRLQKLARGQAQRPLVVAEPPLVFEEAVELEYPVDLLEPLAFLLNRMLEQLCARLAARALAATELNLRFELEASETEPQRHGDTENAFGNLKPEIAGYDKNCKLQIANYQSSESPSLRGDNHFFTRTLHLPVPVLDAKVFLKLLQLDLQAHPPHAPVSKIWLRAEPAEPRRAQNGLFVAQAPETEKLELTLARIERVVGKRTIDGQQPASTIDDQRARVGSPEVLDAHYPDAFRINKFFVPPAVDHRPPVAGKTQNPITALRVFRPPLAAVIALREGKPAHVASPERPAMRGEVVWCAGPWRSSGEWWAEQAWSRQEWDVAVRNEEGVALYRVYCDEVRGAWFVEGSYD